MKKQAKLKNTSKMTRNIPKNGNAQLKKEASVQTKVEAKGKLDIITFIYGFGAAVVLVGAMFKFLGWAFANELFIIGLSIEAIVFLISAFERKEEEIEYKWEQVFPQLQADDSQSAINAMAYGNAMNQFASTLGDLSQNIQSLSESLVDIRENIEDSARNSEEMKSQMSTFNELMDHYNDNLRAINDRYDQVMEA